MMSRHGRHRRQRSCSVQRRTRRKTRGYWRTNLSLLLTLRLPTSTRVSEKFFADVLRMSVDLGGRRIIRSEENVWILDNKSFAFFDLETPNLTASIGKFFCGCVKKECRSRGSPYH